jgi:hypothetical protein
VPHPAKGTNTAIVAGGSPSVSAWEMQQSQRIIPLPGLSGAFLSASVGVNDIGIMPSAVQTSIYTGAEARATSACETKGANALNRTAKQAIQA